MNSNLLNGITSSFLEELANTNVIRQKVFKKNKKLIDLTKAPNNESFIIQLDLFKQQLLEAQIPLIQEYNEGLINEKNIKPLVTLCFINFEQSTDNKIIFTELYIKEELIPKELEVCILDSEDLTDSIEEETFKDIFEEVLYIYSDAYKPKQGSFFKETVYLKEVEGLEKEKNNGETFQLPISDISNILKIIFNIQPFRDYFKTLDLTDAYTLEILADALESLDDSEELILRDMPYFEPKKLDQSFLIKTWGGIQRHYFEELFEDWLYFALNSELNIEYFKRKYRTKDEWQINIFYNTIYDSLYNKDGSEKIKIDIDIFLESFWGFIDQFVISEEQNIHNLTTKEIFFLWNHPDIRERITQRKDYWCNIFQELLINNRYKIDLHDVKVPNDSLFDRHPPEYFFPTFLNGRINSLKESRVKSSIYFHNDDPKNESDRPYRVFLECNYDKILFLDNNTEIYDWKSWKANPNYKPDIITQLEITLQMIVAQKFRSAKIEEKKNVTDRDGYLYDFINISLPYLGYTFENILDQDQVLDISKLPDFHYLIEKFNQKDLAYGIITPFKFTKLEELKYILYQFQRIMQYIIKHKTEFRMVLKQLKSAQQSVASPFLKDSTEVIDNHNALTSLVNSSLSVSNES